MIVGILILVIPHALKHKGFAVFLIPMVHKQMDTTSQYLKVNLTQLRLIALEVPREER